MQEDIYRQAEEDNERFKTRTRSLAGEIAAELERCLALKNAVDQKVPALTQCLANLNKLLQEMGLDPVALPSELIAAKPKRTWRRKSVVQAA